jgi:hypothetical protein
MLNLATGERVITTKRDTLTLSTVPIFDPTPTAIVHRFTLWVLSLGYQYPTMQQASWSIELEE